MNGIKAQEFNTWYANPVVTKDTYVVYLTADGSKKPTEDSASTQVLDFGQKVVVVDDDPDLGEWYRVEGGGYVCGEHTQKTDPLADMELQDAFVVRDAIDIARMAASRACDCACSMFKLAAEGWRCGRVKPDEPPALAARARELLAIMRDVLSASDEFSLYASLQALQEKHETNPKFETTLKGNAENNYCRTQIRELVSDIYIPVIDAFTDYFAKRFDSGNHAPFNDLTQPLKELAQPVVDAFYDKPLADMQVDTEEAFENLPETISTMATIIAELTSL